MGGTLAQGERVTLPSYKTPWTFPTRPQWGDPMCLTGKRALPPGSRAGTPAPQEQDHTGPTSLWPPGERGSLCLLIWHCWCEWSLTQGTLSSLSPLAPHRAPEVTLPFSFHLTSNSTRPAVGAKDKRQTRCTGGGRSHLCKLHRPSPMEWGWGKQGERWVYPLTGVSEGP